jgi:hypothetical protein
MGRSDDESAAVPLIARSAASEIAGMVPGGSTAVTVLEVAFRRRNAAKAREFFERLAIATGASDADAAVNLVAKIVEHDWAAEAVERGYRAMMGALTDEARSCVAVLVAEYLVEKRPPDVAYQRVGALLADASRSALSTLATAASMAVVVIGQTGAEGRLRGFVRTARADADDVYWATGLVSPGEWVRSYSAPSTPHLLPDLGLLSRHGLARDWSGLSSAALKGNPLIEFDSESDNAFRLLDRCLVPIRALPDPHAESG